MTRFSLTNCLIVLLITSSLPRLAPAKDKAPSADDIRAAALRTQARVLERGAAWTAIHTAGGTEIRVDVVRTPLVRCWTTSTGSEPIVKVVERDGVWLVDEMGTSYLSRPHEFPFKLPSLAIFQNRSDLMLMIEADAQAVGKFNGREGNIAHFRAPMAPEGQRMAKGFLAQIEQFEKQDPGGIARRPELKAQAAALRDALENGLPIDVDVEHGFLTSSGNLKMSTRIENFRWLDGDAAENPPEANVGKGARRDLSGGPLAGKANLDDLVMVLHAPLWEGGEAKPDADGRIWNIKTGQMWRIAVPGSDGTLPGCFLRGRRSIVVSAVFGETGAFVPCEVNLDTLAVRKLGGDALASGITMGPVLSPDGKTFAVFHADLGRGVMSKQIHLIDLATGAARPIGKPFDATEVCWDPDGRSLFVERVEPSRPGVPGPRSICRMTLDDGTITVFREHASDPVVLAAQKRVLFRDEAGGIWQTCGLDGKDVQPFGDGLSDYFFPTLSPDGKRVMMMRKDPKRGPSPHVIDISDPTPHRVPTTPGFYGTPAWR